MALFENNKVRRFVMEGQNGMVTVNPVFGSDGKVTAAVQKEDGSTLYLSKPKEVEHLVETLQNKGYKELLLD